MLLRLAWHADEKTDEAWPGKDSIAAAVNVTSLNVANALRGLEATGEIEVVKRGGQWPEGLQRLPGRGRRSRATSLRSSARASSGVPLPTRTTGSSSTMSLALAQTFEVALSRQLERPVAAVKRGPVQVAGLVLTQHVSATNIEPYLAFLKSDDCTDAEDAIWRAVELANAVPADTVGDWYAASTEVTAGPSVR